MEKEKFKFDGNTFCRITKQKARELFEKGDIIALLPSKIHGLAPEIIYKKFKFDNWEFEEYVSNFTFYCCNSKTGRYPKFFKIGGN